MVNLDMNLSPALSHSHIKQEVGRRDDNERLIPVSLHGLTAQIAPHSPIKASGYVGYPERRPLEAMYPQEQSRKRPLDSMLVLEPMAFQRRVAEHEVQDAWSTSALSHRYASVGERLEEPEAMTPKILVQKIRCPDCACLPGSRLCKGHTRVNGWNEKWGKLLGLTSSIVE